jgi:hypothetical protein
MKPASRCGVFDMRPIRTTALALAAATINSAAATAQELQLPPEVTPALRAACEQDVRRLCITQSATVSSVKSCVTRRYVELSIRCKVQIAAAGLTPAGR